MATEFPRKELETLWCPWRVEYFEKEKPNADFLEAAARTSDDAAHLVITRRKERVPDHESLSLLGWSLDGGAVSENGGAFLTWRK